jgi:hypothetical protein
LAAVASWSIAPVLSEPFLFGPLELLHQPDLGLAARAEANELKPIFG